MLARPVKELPTASAWSARYAFEPKFDGYRALVFVTSSSCVVQSRGGRDITRCFPDVAEAAVVQIPPGVVLDGELVVWAEKEGCPDFPALQRRIVSPSRAAALAASQPATFMAFDLLAANAHDFRRKALSTRRARLEDLTSSWKPPLQLVPQTTDPTTAERWMADYAAAPVGVEGLVIKRLDDTYKPGKRAWLKLRIRHTTEAIVGAVTGPLEWPTGLVLGLPSKHGQLLIAGVSTALTPSQSQQIGRLLKPPAGEHPWPAELGVGRLGSWARDKVTVTRVDPSLVVEVETDTAFEFGRWRHPTRFLRARPELDADAVAPPMH